MVVLNGNETDGKKDFSYLRDGHATEKCNLGKLIKFGGVAVGVRLLK